ncbi:MAG: hypothetical protein ACFFHD_14735 [Promethearchaeota archaeon]
MVKINNIDKTQVQKTPIGIYGILSILFGALGDLIAYIKYPGYNILVNVVSSLCLGPGGLFFQFGTAISGLFALLFLIYLEKTFNDEQINKYLRKYAKITGIISCVFFIILGVFCGSNVIIAYIHGISAVISWFTGLFYITLFNILFLKSSKYSQYVAYCGFIVTSILMLLILTFILHFFPAFRFLIIILPSLEWLNTIALMFWYLLVSIYIIHNRI